MPIAVQRRKWVTGVLMTGVVSSISALISVLFFCRLPQEETRKGVQHIIPSINPMQYSRQGVKDCDNVNSPHVELLILILSAPDESEARQAIRETWLSEPVKDVTHVFCIGTLGLESSVLQTVLLEQSQQQDLLIMQNFIDSYDGLSEKVMQCFSMISQLFCYRFVLKCDTDTFVNVKSFMPALKQQPSERLYWGFFRGGASVKRHGQWAEQDWILCDKYLPYARGGGYVLTRDLILYILQNSDFLQRFKSEDVSIGTWLGPLKIYRLHDPRFDTEYKSRGCSNKYLVTHKQNVDMMYELWTNLQKTGQICKQEIQVYKSYVYNWFVPPSLCCIRNDSSIP